MAAGSLEELAGKLAEDTMAAMDECGDDRLYIEVGTVLGASSQSLEEAFLMEIRIRIAERKARRFLVQHLAQVRAKAPAGGASDG